MDVKQFKKYILVPTLHEIGLYSKSAEQLVLGTAVYESGGLKYIHQRDGGPALGICQMEPATHDDIWNNYLKYKIDLQYKITALAAFGGFLPEDLMYNLRYAVAMCRVHYLRKKEPLPEAGDYIEQARYYKKYYNTYLGKGSVDKYLEAYSKYVLNNAPHP